MAETFGRGFKNLTLFKMEKTRGVDCSGPTLLLRELSLRM